MGKKPFTTRIDEHVLAIAQRLATAERRSVTSLIEVAVLDYATRRGAAPSSQDETPVPHVTPQNGRVLDNPKVKVTRRRAGSKAHGGAGRGKPHSR
jgi:hypothetical protein